MNIRWILMGLLLLTLCAAPAGAAVPEGAAPEKEAMPAAPEASTATQEATPTKKEATPKAKEKDMPEVVVEAERLVERQEKITIKAEGLPSKVTVITKEDLQKMPYTGSYLDMFRKVPGVQITRYPGDLIAVGIGMRGFSGGHGTNQGYFVDGVPINYTCNFYGTDLGWLIPEMIERIEIIKGPFSALYGDFALAGVINIVTKKSDPSPSLSGYGGTYGTGRGVGVLSDTSWNPTPFIVWEGYTREGYRDNTTLQRANLFNKLTFPLWQGDLSLRLHYASRKGGMAGYMLLDDVKAGRNPRDALNPSDRGDDEMFDIVMNYKPKGGEEGFHGTLFFSNLLHNEGRTSTSGQLFTNGPQSRWHGRHNYFGWKLMYNYQPFDNFSLIAGNDMRYDDVKLVSFNAKDYYTIVSMTNDYHIWQVSNGFFAQAQYKPFSFIKITGGLRYDFFNIDVENNLNPANSGVANPGVFSPKIGLVITPYQDINLFANRGQGFRSPRYNELSPSKGTKSFDLDPAKIDTWDVGINALLFKRVFFSFAYYNTLLQREVWRNPVTLMYENLGDSVRTGFEIELRLFLTKELTLYGSFADVRARLKNPLTPGAYYITGVSPNIATVGFEFNKPWGKDHRVGLDFYWVHYARTPADTTGTVIGPQVDHFMTKLIYGYRNWTASLDVNFTPGKYPTDLWSSSSGRLTYDPWPSWEVLGGLKYRFY